jgi:hypothetical protein
MGEVKGAAANAIRAADLVPRLTGFPGDTTEVAQQMPGAGSEVTRGNTVTLRMIRPNCPIQDTPMGVLIMDDHSRRRGYAASPSTRDPWGGIGDVLPSVLAVVRLR